MIETLRLIMHICMKVGKPFEETKTSPTVIKFQAKTAWPASALVSGLQSLQTKRQVCVDPKGSGSEASCICWPTMPQPKTKDVTNLSSIAQC